MISTLWVIITLASPAIGPFHIYQTQEACNAAIGDIPKEQREAIDGANYICSEVIIHHGERDNG